MTVGPGDKIHGTFWGGESTIEILENSPERLRWKGTWHGMVAERVFAWEAVEGDPSKTRLVQSEESRGALISAILMVDGWMGANLKKKFVVLNEDLKVYCERQV